MKTIIYLVFVIILSACKGVDNKSEIYQNSRNNIINIHDNLKEIKINDVLISKYSQPYILNNYLIIADYTSIDKSVHIFNKKEFSYLLSTGILGMGPDEITSFSSLAINNSKNEFYITDSGKQKIFTYNMDSLINNSNYKHSIKGKIGKSEFPNRFIYINDSLSYASTIIPTGNTGYNQCIAEWNMNTNIFTPIKYTHPEIEKIRLNMTVSIEHDMIVACYDYHDLISILDLDGNLKYNIYGPNWNNEKSNKNKYYSSAIVAKDLILATSSFGRDNFSQNEYLPTSILIFDLSGNYHGSFI